MMNSSPLLAAVPRMLLLVLLLLTPCLAVVFEAGKAADTVVALHKGNFKLAMEDPANAFWLLKFYAPW